LSSTEYHLQNLPPVVIKFPKFSIEVRLQLRSPPFALPPLISSTRVPISTSSSPPPTLIPPSFVTRPAATGPNQSTAICLCSRCRCIVVEFKKNEDKTMDSSSQPKLNVPDSPMSPIESDSDIGHNEYPNDSDYRYELDRVNTSDDLKMIIRRLKFKNVKSL